MATGTALKEPSDSTSQLKSIVEQSLAVLCKREDAPTEISRRSLPLHVDVATLQKGAIVNAAKALASLWKVSEPRRPRLQQYGRQTT